MPEGVPSNAVPTPGCVLLPVLHPLGVSTRIFHGYRVDVDGLGGLFEFTDRFRTHLSRVAEDLYLETAARLATFAADQLVTGSLAPGAGEEEDELLRHRSPVRYAASVLAAAHREVQASGRRDPLCDLQFEVVFLSDPHDRAALYALVFCESDVLTSAWEALPEVVPWPYWNSSDAPDDVSPEEWEQRRVTWDRLVGFDAPARRGISLALLGPHLPWTASAHLARLVRLAPSPLERAHQVASRQLPLPTSLDFAAFRARSLAADELAPSLVKTLVPLDEDLLSRVP